MELNTNHIVRSYDRQLQFLAHKIAEMGGLAETMLDQAVTAIVTADTKLAQLVIDTDPILDLSEREINEKAIALIAKRQPMAIDLREIVGSIRIASDLERIGDMAKNIAKRASAMTELPFMSCLQTGIKEFSALALSQVKEVLDCYASRQVQGISAVRDRDDQLDSMYTALFIDILKQMSQDSHNIAAGAHLLFCAKNIERIGDHATNIAETVYFIITGQYMDADRPRDDLSHGVISTE